VLEERIAALEGGRAALAAASGMAASAMVALLTLCEAGDHIVAARTLYGGTHSQLDFNFKRFGIEATLVDADDPKNFRRAIKPKTKVPLRRDHRQSARQRARHRSGGGHRARGRRAAGDRQHLPLALPVPAVQMAPTSSCIRPPSSSAATAPPWAG
jgi:hypothetical protein